MFNLRYYMYFAIHSLAFTILYYILFTLLFTRSLTSPGTPRVYSCIGPRRVCECVCMTDRMSGIGRVKAYYYYFRVCARVDNATAPRRRMPPHGRLYE